MGVIFLTAIILLIFFSKTIYAYNLPVVTAVKPQNGTLDKLEISSGIADWADVENIYASVSGIAGELLVKEGDQVNAGQALFRMDFDRDEAEQKLKEIENNRKKLQIDILNINLKLDNIEQSINGSAGGEAVSNYELSMINMDIKKAESALEEAKLQYEYGEISLRDLEAAQNNLQALYLKREDTIAGYKTDKAALQSDLQTKNIDLADLALQEESCRKTLDEYDAYTVITAPVGGTLFMLNIQKGVYVNENSLTASIGTGNKFSVECPISLENNFVVPGDTCELDNSSHVLDGVVASVTPTAQGKTVKITVASDDVTAGETFDITFEKNSATSYTLVPNGALNQDDDGYFLNLIKRRDGILGKEYYVERLDVYIGNSDSKNTAIVKGITFFEPVVLVSDKPVTAGDVINLENAGDFFED